MKNYNLKKRVKFGISKLRYLIDTYGYDNENIEYWLEMLRFLNDETSDIEKINSILSILENCYRDDVWGYSSNAGLPRK